MVVNLSQYTADSRSDNIGKWNTSIQARQVFISIFSWSYVRNNSWIVKYALLYYDWTKIWDPANSPVNARQNMRGHIVFDIPWNREPNVSI